MSNLSSATVGDIASAYQDWIGRSTLVEDEINLSAVRRMAATLDLDPASFRHGSAIGPHWYSMFFTANATRSQIGHDGHPKKGDFLPPIPLPRRMFAGRTVTFPGVLKVGDQAQKRSEIIAIEQKQGRSGTLVFLKVRHTISVDGQARVVEQQEVVYRDAPTGDAKPAAAVAAPAGGAWSADYDLDPVLVFRYSALTWNGHRIHYDADYARQVEGYPGCVMNGALTLHLVIEEALRQAAGRPLHSLKARLVKPLFVGGRLQVAGQSLAGSQMEAWAADETGALAASCTLQFSDTPDAFRSGTP